MKPGGRALPVRIVLLCLVFGLAAVPVPRLTVRLAAVPAPRPTSGLATVTVPSASAAVPPSVSPQTRLLVSGGEDVRIHHAPGDSARAARMLRYLRGQPPLPGLPDSVPSGVHVYLAPDEDRFRQLTGGRAPEWGAGVAIPRLDRIVMPGFGGINTRGRTEARVLRHEWAHVGLGQHLAGLRVPRWFDEGYAEWTSGGWDAREGWRLRIALTTGGGPSLDSLSLRWPRDRASAQVAYMLGGTAVEYLVQRSGLRGLELLLARARASGSFEEAFRSVYGVTTAQFEEDWREYVKGRYGWLFVLSHSLVFWLFLGVVLAAMVWVRRRRNREAMARLRATEPPPDPEWWSDRPPPEGPPSEDPLSQDTPSEDPLSEDPR